MDPDSVSSLEPIVLNPVTTEIKPPPKPSGWRRTLVVMASGWLVGNLIVGALFSLIVVFVVSETGLVKVPILTDKLFGRAQIASANTEFLKSANEKIDRINSLSEGQALPKITISEDEITALMTDTFNKKGSSIINPTVKIEDSKFIFTGNLKETAAPIQVEGNLETSGGIVHFGITKTVFGRLSLPPQIMESYLNSALEKIGFSLNATQIPARQVVLKQGKMVLEEVSLAQ